MKENIIQVKSFAFAIRIVNAYKYLQSEKRSLYYQNKCCEVAPRLEQMWKKQLEDNLKKTSSQKYLLHTKRLEKQNIG